MLKKLKKIFKYLILLFSLLLLFLTIYIKYTFKDIVIDQLIYNVINSEGTSIDAILGGLIFVIIGIVISIITLFILKKIMSKIHIIFSISFKNKELKTDLFDNSNRKQNIFLVLFLCFSLFLTIESFKIDEYIKNQFLSSQIFEDYYIDARDINIEFPKEKQNLIYIYVESLEMTNASKINGGALDNSYIPNLEVIALNNLNFSNTSNLGGGLQISGTAFTAGAMVAQTAAVPLKVPIDGNAYTDYGNSFPGVYNLGDILLDNGYKNYIMMGSNASFGGREDYFNYHGDYTIYDYKYAKENNWIDKDYKVWWGYEDSKLYEFAKTELLKISKEDNPFNFTILTADTHFIDGYLDKSCPEKYDSKYANSFNCADIMLSNFIDWIKKQDFYQNTTIIITGDHLTMQQGFYDNIASNYDRNVYNAFINSKVVSIKSKNRIFSSLDLYPTTLAALGVKIEGERIGLGTNLFSDKKTLEEELGFKFLNDELLKKSFYYDNSILGDTYYEMLKVVE